jgi:anthocyanidin reductase
MPAPGGGLKTACVTRGNGYIAPALVKMLLEKGYAVKTTVRDPGSSIVHAFVCAVFAIFCL